MNIICDFLINRFKLKDFFFSGDYWILFVGVGLVIGWFWLLFFYRKKQYEQYLTIFCDRLFLLPAVIILFLFFGTFLFLKYRPIEKDRLVIGIADFVSAPQGAGAAIRDRLEKALRDRASGFKEKLTIKTVEKTIDCSSQEGIAKAKKIAEDSKVHIFICGKIRIDEEYFFEPIVINLIEFRFFG